MPQNNWKKAQVAREQYELVQRELLMDVNEVAPYKYFLEAMREAEAENAKTLLDIGCGVGQYAVLCLLYYPQIQYHGTDFSEDAIEYAKELAPFASFGVTDISETYICGDIILTASSIEYADDPWRALGDILDAFGETYIMHRVRLCSGKSHHFTEPIYAGQEARHFAWNLEELEAFITKFGLSHTVISWEDGRQVTLVIKRGKDGLVK